MNKFFILVLITFISKGLCSQAITNQLTITPVNPSPTDTIYVISKLTYSGNCNLGLVYTNTAVAGNTIQLMPTYCGYGSTTTCVSTDTLKIHPLAVGNYIIKVEYHQGSVCPISGFDATIGQATIAVSVQTPIATGFNNSTNRQTGLKIYPNPASKSIGVEISGIDLVNDEVLMIRTILGTVLLNKKAETRTEQLDISTIPPGVYILEVRNYSHSITQRRLIVE